MAFQKINYVSGSTKITARNLNDIQDEVIRLSNITGEQGPQGEQGPAGSTGPQGQQGPKGDAGPKGEQGIQGEIGPKGNTGIQGEKGDQGEPFKIKKIYSSISEMNADFNNSEVKIFDFVIINSSVDDEDNSKLFIKGASNFTVVTDLSGAQGIEGPKGQTGEQGLKGEQGPAGIQGEIGPKGEQGNQGIQGTQGIQGETGPQGAIGQQGLQGEKGEAFNYEDFTKEQLALLVGPKGEQGSKGEIGPKGEQGLKGNAFVYEDFTADQLSALKGNKGDKGETGLTGSKGDTGKAFTYNDFTPEQIEGLKGPQGIQGAKGDQGIKGDTGEQGLIGEQGPTGLAGEKGLTGAQGQRGADGRDIELRKSETHIQWKYETEASSAWRDLVALKDITGPSGGIEGGFPVTEKFLRRYQPAGGEGRAWVVADGPGVNVTISGNSAELTVPDGVLVSSVQIKFFGADIGTGNRCNIKHNLCKNNDDFLLPHIQCVNYIKGNMAMKTTVAANFNLGLDWIEITSMQGSTDAVVNLRLI